MSTPAQLGHLYVVLVSTRNPLNIGAAARAMSNFGFLRLRVVNPYDPAFREARSAVGASLVLTDAEQFSSVAEAVADCALVVGTSATGQRDLHHPLRTLEEGAALIHAEPPSGRVALLFGSEKTGLSTKDLSHCHWILHIPTRSEHLSMNLGQAVALCLYEISRTVGMHSQPSIAPEMLANASEIERLTVVLLQALHASEYVSDPAPMDIEERVRRLVRRLNLRVRDAEALLGMLRHILWKLRSGHS